jgi:altronate dehydratase
MVAAGCQAVIFTTGRGTPTGNAIAPVIKVTANGRTYKNMEDNMDVDLSAIVRVKRPISRWAGNWLTKSMKWPTEN